MNKFVERPQKWSHFSNINLVHWCNSVHVLIISAKYYRKENV